MKKLIASANHIGPRHHYIHGDPSSSYMLPDLVLFHCSLLKIQTKICSVVQHTSAHHKIEIELCFSFKLGNGPRSLL